MISILKTITVNISSKHITSILLHAITKYWWYRVFYRVHYIFNCSNEQFWWDLNALHYFWEWSDLINLLTRVSNIYYYQCFRFNIWKFVSTKLYNGYQPRVGDGDEPDLGFTNRSNSSGPNFATRYFML